MQASLTFNLPEDQELYKYHCKVMEYRTVINDFKSMLRNWEKGGINPEFEQIKDIFNSLLAGIEYE